MAGRRLQRLPETRVEPAPNSKYVPISEMRLITCDYGIMEIVGVMLKVDMLDLTCMYIQLPVIAVYMYIYTRIEFSLPVLLHQDLPC